MGGKGSGGAHGGPQYNPANISATGGAGQSGGAQGKVYIPGMHNFGVSGKDVMAQQSGAPMYSDKAPTAPAVDLPQVTPITAETQLPDQHVMHGSASGPGPSSVPGLPVQLTNDPDLNDIQRNLPFMEFWASQPGASQSTKDYVQYLRTIVAQPGNITQ